MVIKLRNTLRSLVCIFALAVACEPFYDPIEENDVPTSPGTVWDKKTFTVKKTTERPFTTEDLSGSMSLPQLLDIALYNNPSTRASWNASRAAAYAYHGSLSEFYPSIGYLGSLNAQTNKGTSFASSSQGIVANTTPVSTSTSTQRSITNLSNDFSASYLLLDFGGRDANAEFYLQSLYASNWQHDLVMQQVMLSVLNAYISYLGNQAMVAAYEQDLRDAQITLNAAQVMRNAGLATLTDVLLAQSNLEQIRTNLVQAEGAEKTAIGEVLINLGLPADAEISLTQLPQDLPLIEISGNITTLLEQAKTKRPDLGVAIAAIKQQEAQLALSYSNSMPALTANANWNQILFISPRKPSGYNEVAYFQLEFPIFQGFYYMNQQRQLRAQIEEALANLDVQIATISTQIVTNYYALKSAEAALPSSQAAVEYSQRAFRGFVAQYKTGTSSILDVLNALTSLSNARSQLIVIRTQWAAALANLAYSVGVLYDTSGHWQKAPPEELYQLPLKDNYESANR